MRLALLLSRLLRLPPRLVGAITLASLALATGHAANLPPELSAPLPASLTLARGATSAPLALTDHFRDPDVPGSAVRVTTRIGAETRVMDLALFDATAPQTVANFLAYVDAGRYAANFFHRSVPGFIIQNGGFFFQNDTTPALVPTYAPVVNEPGASNLRGTIAMAKLGPPSGSPPTEASINSATSQWFINLANNSANLDAQNGGFTVFGRVLGDGMQVADAIAALPRYNATAYASAWTDLPLTTGILDRQNFIETSAARIAPLAFAVTSDDPALVTPSLTDGVLTLVASAELDGTTTIRITATDLEGGTLVSSFSVHAGLRPQSITFPALDQRTYDPTGDTLRLAATSDAGLPVAYTVVYGPAHLAEDGVTLVITGAGEIAVSASQPGDSTFLAAESVTRTLVVAQAAQTLAFTTLPPALIDKLTLRDTYPEVSFPVAATSSSGLPVLIRLTAEVTPSETGDWFNSATVALHQASLPTASDRYSRGSLVIDNLIIIGTPPLAHVTDRGELTFYRRVEGKITLTAIQEGDANHLPAEPVSFTIDVGRTQTIAFAQPSPRAFNPAAPASTRTFALAATATSRLPVAFEVVSGPATLAADRRTLTLHDTGTVVLRASQPGDAAYLPAPPVTRTLLVNGAKQTLAFTAPSATTFTYGDEPVSLAATTGAPGGGAAFPITFSVVKGPATLAADGHTLSFTGAGTVVLLANQLGGAGISPASLTRTLVVRKKDLLVSGVPDWRAVGIPNPPLALTYEGFVNGDTEADLAATRPKPVTSATKSSPAGDYPITFTGGLDANYLYRPGPVKHLTLLGFGGTYDALVGDESAPLGKLTLTIPANSLSYTGTLTLASEAKTVSIKSAAPLAFPDRYDEATGTWTRPAATGLPSLTLVFSLSTEDGAWAGAKGGRIQGPGFDHPFELSLRGRPASVPLAGPHTLALAPPTAETSGPATNLAGYGHATVRIAPKTAVLSLAGALADGSKLTATIQPNIGGTTYLLWTNPYGTRLDSYFAGHLNIEHFSTLVWKKAASEKDAGHRAGFGPLLIDATITPWLPPVAAKPAKGATPAITLADRLGLVTSSATGSAVFGLDYLPPDGASFTEMQIDGLPAALALTTAGNPVLPKPNPAKFALTLNPSTGAFSGSFVLTDTIPAPTTKNPDATKLHPRKVTFSGVLRHTTPGEIGYPVGQGFFLLPALPGTASTEQVSGEIRLTAPSSP